jgi:hypothetical protein
MCTEDVMVLRILNSIILEERNCYVKSASMVDVYSLNIGSLNVCHNSTRHEIVLIDRIDRKTCLDGTLHCTGFLKSI